MSLPALPRLLRIIAEEAGIDVAVRAAHALGGKRIYISRTPKASDPLVLAVGLEAAQKIGDAVGGDAVEFPRGQAAVRRMVTAELVKRGDSANQIATVLKMTYRWARQLRRATLKGAPAKPAHRPRRTPEKQLDIEAWLRNR